MTNPVQPIDPGVRIGHVHLKVADLERALAFYCSVLGFQLMQRYGSQAAFVSAGGYHHHIGLNTWESAGGRPPARGTTGLFHAAILYPTRAALADALRRLESAGIPLDGASDDDLSRLLTFPNVLITSHQAFLTQEALQEIARVTIANLVHGLRSEPFLDGTRLG